jgi:hypothetical protein
MHIKIRDTVVGEYELFEVLVLILSEGEVPLEILIALPQFLLLLLLLLEYVDEVL